MVLMPAVRKVSKEQIIDAAVEVLRDDGFSAINARSVAKKLGCSTQPIYFSFKNMDELKTALPKQAIELVAAWGGSPPPPGGGPPAATAATAWASSNSLPRKSSCSAGSIWRANSQGHIKAMF